MPSVLVENREATAVESSHLFVRKDVFGITRCYDSALIQENHALAASGQDFQVMTHKHDCQFGFHGSVGECEFAADEGIFLGWLTGSPR